MQVPRPCWLRNRVCIMLWMAAIAVLVVISTLVGLAHSEPSAHATEQTTAVLRQSLAGTKASVFLFSTGQWTAKACDTTIDWDLGCNNWWLRNEGWATYTANAAADSKLLSYNLPAGANRTTILYWSLFLADPIHGGTALGRLDTVVTNLYKAGSQVILFVGRPEYHGNGTPADTSDIVHDNPSGSFARFSALLSATLAVPAVQSYVQWVSVYWMSAYCVAHGAGFCSDADITSFNSRLQGLVHAAGSDGQRAQPFSYLQHVDGPFWDGCWPQPCNPSSWVVGGYSPASLSGIADGIMGESWVQGSLRGSVRTLWQASGGTFNASNTLLLNDVPNCDLYPYNTPCSTSPSGLATDTSTWYAWLGELGLAGTWGVWDAIDGGVADPTYYGDIMNNGTGLTAKGLLHRQAVLDGL